MLRRLAEVRPREAEVISGAPEHIFFSHRRSGGTDWYWIVNDSQEARDLRMRFPRAGVFEKWDAESGARTGLNSDGAEVSLHLDPWDAFFVVQGPACRRPLRQNRRGAY